MAGASIVFEFRHAEFTAALKRLDATGPRRTALLRAIGVGLQHATIERFETATSPAGAAWAGLNPAYAATKRGPGILREAGMRGGLQGSITFATGTDTVTVGSNKVYAAVHQFGATIRPNGRALVFPAKSRSDLRGLGERKVFAKSVTIPARPYLGFGKQDELMVLDAVAVLLPGGR